MEVLGYVEGINIIYIYDGPKTTREELFQVATQLVESEVDLILALTTPAAQEVQKATAVSKTPVVFMPVTDPVGSGLVTKLSQPDGNLTGVTNLSSENLRLEWLLKVAPTIKKIFITYNSNDPSANYAYEVALAAAAEKNLELISEPVTDIDQMRQAIQDMPEDAEAIFMLPDGMAISAIKDFVDIAIQHNIPLCAPTTTQVEEGALMSYGLDLGLASEQAAGLADQILKGENPAVLPVEESDFYFALNIKTAEEIGLSLSDSILNQAKFIFPKDN